MEQEEGLKHTEAATLMIDIATRLITGSMRGDTGTPFVIHPDEAVDIAAVIVGYAFSARILDRMLDVSLDGRQAAEMIEAQLAAITQRLQSHETATTERSAKIYAAAFGVG